MKLKLILTALIGVVISGGAFAQSSAKTSGDKKNAAKGADKAVIAEHIGTWKLVSQKVILASGQIFMGDSTNTFQHKILTPTSFVVVIEKKIPQLDNKKLATSVAGGRYTLVDGNYEELTHYASFKDFETMKVLYKLTIEDGKLHTVGTVGNATYDELYVREN